MKTFRWTVPEPAHADPEIMQGAQLAYWHHVRARGVEWYVVSKGLWFVLLYPLLGCLALGRPIDPGLFTEAWLLGLATGYSVWLRRESRYRTALGRGHEPPADRPAAR